MATYAGEDQTAQLYIWLRLHGANPDELTLDGDMTISTDDNGVRWLHWVEYALINGGRYVNPWGTGAAVEKHTTRLVAPPPDWWAPQIQPTRERLLEAVAAVRKLHVANANSGTCEHCSERDYPDYAVPWPCPTMQAIGNLAAPPVPDELRSVRWDETPYRGVLTTDDTLSKADAAALREAAQAYLNAGGDPSALNIQSHA